MHLTLFDLDNTLLEGDSDVEWARHLIDLGVLDRATYEARNEQFFADYRAGTLDIQAFLAFQLAPLASHRRQQLDAWHHDFMQSRIRPMMSTGARAAVQRHLAAGDLVAVVTATNSFVTAPICRAFGIEHLVATIAEEVDGRFTGRASGTPCFQAGKIERTQAWLASLGKTWGDFRTTTFYSDSRNDLPLLEMVSQPVAVRPDAVLRATAEARGWTIVEAF